MMTVPEEMTLFGSLPCGAGCGKGTPGAGDGAAEAECLRSGPFTLRRYAQGRTSALSSRGYVLLFCLRGSVELRLRSFSYRLTPRCVAAVDCSRLAECRCGADAELLEYRPRMGSFASRGSCDELPAFTVLPSRARLNAWAGTVSRHIREGAAYDRDSSCAVRVQLRDLSGGVLPYPFACAAGCPRWSRCAAVAGYGGWSPVEIAVAAGDPQRPLRERVVTAVAATLGIGLWGGLLLYGTWLELMQLFG